MPNTNIYNNGASFQNENTPGKLYVTDRSMVSNLNAELFQNKEPADFLCIDKSSSASTYGIKQSGKTITMAGETINLDSNSEIRIGNLVIKSADGGNGILIGKV